MTGHGATTGPVPAGSPRRVQLRRSRGWRKPDGAVVVARPTRWGNPFRAADYATDHPGRSTAELRALAVADFRDVVEGRRTDAAYPSDLAPLRGRDLACWCPLDGPCHADVLLELAASGDAAGVAR